MEMDGTMMGFPDRTFDTVAMANSMHHLARIEDALSEMVRVLRDGGLLLICEPICDGEQSEAQRTETAIHHWSADVDMALGKFHRHTYQRGEVRSLMEGLGLEQLEFMEASRPLDCLFCEDALKCEDPLDEGIVSAAHKDLQEDLERLDMPGDTPPVFSESWGQLK